MAVGSAVSPNILCTFVKHIWTAQWSTVREHTLLPKLSPVHQDWLVSDPHSFTDPFRSTANKGLIHVTVLVWKGDDSCPSLQLQSLLFYFASFFWAETLWSLASYRNPRMLSKKGPNEHMYPHLHIYPHTDTHLSVSAFHSMKDSHTLIPVGGLFVFSII